MSNPTYKCDECGACCSGKLIIEIDHIDVVREPRLLEHVVLLDGHGTIQFDSEWEKQYGLACGRPCGLLQADGRCGIYPTRPNVCIAFEAGSWQCQDARRRSGLTFLPDASGRVITEDEFEAMEP